MRAILLAGICAILPGVALAEVKTKKIEYKYDGKTFIGHMSWDDAIKGKRPGVLVVHEWWGLNDYAKMRADELAKLGYVAFACDMYGDGKTVDHPMDAGKMATEVRKNVETWRGRAQAAMKILKADEHCEAKSLAAIGYCFGGTTALQLSAVEPDLKAVVTFHSALPKLTVDDAKKIKANVQVNHGKADFFIKEESIAEFKKTLMEAKVPLTFNEYEDAVHSFTVVGADKLNIKGMAYNKAADEKSWASMKKLFSEVLK